MLRKCNVQENQALLEAKFKSYYSRLHHPISKLLLLDSINCLTRTKVESIMITGNLIIKGCMCVCLWILPVSHKFVSHTTQCQGLTAYVDSLYSTYLVVLIRLSYDDSIYLVIENMTYDQRFHMKVKRCQGVKNHVQRLNELELFIARILLTLGVLIILNLSKSPGVVTQKSKD